MGMFSLNIQSERVWFKDIRLEHLPQILEWYNKVSDFKYATGMDTPITLDQLTQKYAETSICSNEFFAGIREKKEEKMIGILKGSIRRERGICSLWISSLAIDRPYQGKGYGSDSLNLLFEHIKAMGGIENAYISVIENNSQGRAFWVKHGFREMRKISGHIKLDNKDQDVIIMQKPLLCKTLAQ